MIDSVKKMKLLAGSVLVSVFVLGLGQEVCGIAGGNENNRFHYRPSATPANSPAHSIDSDDEDVAFYRRVINRSRDESNVINFRTYEDILGYVRRMTGGEEHIWSGRRWEEFNTWIYRNVRQFRRAIAGHTIGRHFFGNNGEYPGAPTTSNSSSYFCSRINDLERIFNSLVVDPRGINLMEGVADVDRLGYGYYNGQTRERGNYEVVTFDVAINVRSSANIAWERVYRNGRTEHHARCNQVMIRYILTDNLQWRVVSIWPKN